MFLVHDDSDRMVLNFIDKLRQHEFFRTAWFIYMCESNTGTTSGHHATLLSGKPKVYCVRERSDRDAGVLTTFETKQQYAKCLEKALKDPALCFMEDFICVTMKSGQFSAKRQWLQEELLAQLLRSQRVAAKLNNNGIIATRVGWTAKCKPDGTPSNSFNDDIAVCLGLNLHYSARFLSHTLRIDYDMFIE